MPDNNLKTAGTLSARASKSLTAMSAHVTRADAARSDAAHQVCAAQVVDAATTAAAANRAAAEAWDALATHATKQALACRHGAELADRNALAFPTRFHRLRQDGLIVVFVLVMFIDNNTTT